MGYKEFGAELLLAADVNEYLMRQAVIRVANALERDAIPNPEPGMVVWRDDAARHEAYTGTAWQLLWAPDTGWLDLQLVNGWTVSSGHVAQYRRVGAQVFLRGRVTGGTDAIIATLPPGFRPDQWHQDAIRDGGTNNVGVLLVNSAGNITRGGTLTTPNLNTTFPLG